jgi:DNA-binding transcriptional MocR family regulator
MSALMRLGRAGAKGFYLMPTCHNPTGASTSLERREALVAWSHDAGVPFIEDDYGADLVLGNDPLPPALRSLDGNVIYVGSFSKKLIPALRIGFLMCPAPLRPLLVSLKHAMDLGSSLLLQHVLAEFLERGYMRAHLGRVLPEYRARRDALEKGLAAHLPKGFRWHRPERGVIAWLPLPADWSSEAVCEEARRHGVLASPSTLYSVEPREPPGIRLTFCAEPTERLREGARRLGKAFAAVAADQRLTARSMELEFV